MIKALLLSCALLGLLAGSANAASLRGSKHFTAGTRRQLSQSQSPVSGSGPEPGDWTRTGFVPNSAAASPTTGEVAGTWGLYQAGFVANSPQPGSQSPPAVVSSPIIGPAQTGTTVGTGTLGQQPYGQTIPICGDGICLGAAYYETCSSCPQDCGVCGGR